MNILVKLASVLLFFSFICVSWIDFNGKKLEVNCEIDLGPNIMVNPGESVQLEAITNYPLNEIEWINWFAQNVNFSCTNCLDPIVSTMENTCFYMVVGFSDGCSATDDICIMINDSCEESFSENKIKSITPQSISDQAIIELEIAQTQFVHIEIVENDEITNILFEGWLRNGLHNLNLDFSNVAAGNHSLRVRLYPENKFISITKL